MGELTQMELTLNLLLKYTDNTLRGSFRATPKKIQIQKCAKQWLC